MKKSILLVSFLFLAAGLFAQTDFSGKWKLNSSKSKLNQEFSMAPGSIVVTQKGNDLSVEKHSNFQGQEFVSNDKLTLDGKECINTGMMDSQKKSNCTWSADKKMLTVTSKIPFGEGGDMSQIEIYKIDGVNLVIENKITSSFGDMTETMVYDKQ
jgi:hypothetical protein